jgi:FkbM family methyltransferase
MIGIFNSYSQLFRSNIPRNIKRKLFFASINLEIKKRLFKLINPKNKYIKICNNKVYYNKYNTLVYLFRSIFLDNEYYFNSIKKNPYIIDCGSNIGMSILYFKLLYPESEIIGFEPDEKNLSTLELNVRENNLKNVTIYKKGVSNSKGKLKFFYGSDEPDSLVKSLVAGDDEKYLEIDTDLLSSYINKDVDFLKLDIEGAELDVITDLIQNGKLGYVKEMIMEYHHHLKNQSDNLSAMLKYLEDSGFKYQLGTNLNLPFTKDVFQGILIYAYQKPLSL